MAGWLLGWLAGQLTGWLAEGTSEPCSWGNPGGKSHSRRLRNCKRTFWVRLVREQDFVGRQSFVCTLLGADSQKIVSKRTTMLYKEPCSF